MRAWLWMAVALGSSSVARGEDPRPDMQGIAAEITSLQKFLLTDTDFSAPGNAGSISGSLAALERHLAHLEKGAFQQDPSLRVNLSLLQSHVKDARRAFASDAKPYARFMMQSSLQLCIACHTRKKAADFSWPEPAADGVAEIDRADYYFATRQFQKGRVVYERLVEGFPENKAGQWNLRRALLALAVYFARVTEDAKEGASAFQKLSRKAAFPQYLREELAAWAEEFARWSKEAAAGKKAEDEAALLGRAKKLLRHDDFSLVSSLDRSFHVRRLRASTLLQRVLEGPGEKSPRKGEALLLLGQIYPRLSSNLFFRFGEMYLKACVTDYSKTATARSCYVALEAAVAEGYTGSAGTNVPEDEQVELMRLKRLAY